MSEETRDDSRLKVTAVGNSWIVCKSKSHAGHVYYFNTLTGEAAWNLSASEIEKAKSRTKHLENLPGAEPTRCPEPKEKPPTLISDQSQSKLPESFLNNDVSENQSSVMTFSNMANKNTRFISPLNQISGLRHSTRIINTPVPELPTVSNLNLSSINNPINTFNLNHAPIIYNPKVWDVPQTQQVFMAPTVAPLVNHTPASLIIANENLPQNMSEIAPFQTKLNNFENGSATFHPRYAQGGVQHLNKNLVFTSKSDLRQKLSAKKHFNMLPPVGNSGGSETPRTEFSNHIASNVEGIQTNQLSGRTLENRYLETPVHESPSKIDLSPLKCLAPSDSKSDDWFIIVDLGVLLKEFKFMTSLTDSDDQCHLMVPKQVMDELKSFVKCTEDIQSRRILRFLSQQIETGYAFMAEEPSEHNCESITDAIYATCTELSQAKYHLILLSNDNELLTHQNPSNIKIFSTDEVKKLLLENPNKQLVSTVPKKPFMLDGLMKKIKIIVPNDTVENTDTTNQKDDIPVTVSKPQQNKTQDKTTESTVSKYTVDAGIQTDFEDINASINIISNVADKQELNHQPSSTSAQKSIEVSIKRDVSSDLKVSNKKREIKLKRSTSNQPAPAIDSAKKQFKWRRRRNTTPQVIKASSHYSQNTSPTKDETRQSNALPDKISIDNTISGQNENKIADDVVESRESSIIADHRNCSMNDNVTIEETSTSGIISNTESNVDDDSNYSYLPVNQKQIVNNTKCNMYEIENVTMEECLKIKSDEWVSRFIQIMEEALSQVLRQDPPFSHSAMPPPWTLHEASQCIAIKFYGHRDIIEAANKLSSILFDVSDAKGKIAVDMTPYQYMQMYSYGVHLLAAIKKVNNNCEDIQMAVEALKKLLDDIKNQNMDVSTNDTFNDNIQDNVSNGEVSVHPDNQITNSHEYNGLHEEEMLSDHNMMQEDSHHSYKKRKLNTEESPKPVQFIRNINIKSDTASLFFKTLNLKKSVGNYSKFKLKSNDSNKPETRLHEIHNFTRIEEQQNSHSLCENAENVADSVVSTNEPKIIRNFSVYPDFEKKIKMRVYEDHGDDFNYKDDYNECILKESEKHNEQCHDVNISEVNESRTLVNEKNEPKDPKAPTVEHIVDDNSKKFKYFMYSFIQEIRNILCQARILCDQCYEVLKKPEGSMKQICQLRKSAESAHLHITQLCRSLESMLDRANNNPSQSMCDILKQAGIEICDIDHELLFEYRMAVAKCKNFGDVLVCSIQNILSAFKS